MLKLITLPGVSDTGDILIQAILPGAPLVKTASAALHPEIQQYMAGLKSRPDKLYVLVNALGAGEWYGSNINGDYFEERELNTPAGSEFGFRTFLDSGVYRHHVNKDIKKSFGKVVVSVYNPVMHRVELIIEIDRKKAAEEGHGDLVEQLDAGKNPAVSMGCRVAFDVCSICGNKSKTRNDYCLHAKTMMNQVLPDGRKVFVLNPNPKFFDISFVLIGADRTSYAMAKVASVYGVSPRNTLSADLAEEFGLRDRSSVAMLREKLANKQKLSNMVKNLPAMSSRIMPGVTGREPDLPNVLLNRLAQQPINRTLTSMSAAGMVLKPEEYQRLVLIRMGRPAQADMLSKQGMVFRPSSRVDRSIVLGEVSDYDVDIRDMVLPYVRQRTAFDPIVSDRLAKTASTADSATTRFADDALLDKIASGYNGYREQLLLKMGSIVANITSRDSKLLATLAGTDLEDMFKDHSLVKSAASASQLALLGAIPLAYLYGAHAGSTGEATNTVRSWVAEHPVLATSVLVGLTRLGVGLKQSGVLDKSLNNFVGKLS